MLERVYDTIRAILYDEMPKDYNGKIVIYDRPITGWYIGERDIKNTNLSVTFKGGQSNLKDIGLGLQELSYSIKIEVDAGADNIEYSERLVQETVRMILAVMRKHRRIWVVEICPICGKFVLTPEHFILEHNDILSTYVSGVVADYEALWYRTHPASIAPATLPNSSKGTEAFLRMYEDVRQGNIVANLPSQAEKNILRMQSDFIEPVRILYDVICSDNQFSDDATGRALQKGGGVSITAKELIKQQYYGPDNVNTSAVKFI
jgi:hypothetical protein